MEAVLEALRKLDEPTDEEFVGAVIHTHERIRSKLRALSHGTSVRDRDWAFDDAEIIRAYSLSHGVEAGEITADRCAASC